VVLILGGIILGNMYFDRPFSDKDKAISCYEMAKSAGNVEAQRKLTSITGRPSSSRTSCAVLGLARDLTSLTVVSAEGRDRSVLEVLVGKDS